MYAVKLLTGPRLGVFNGYAICWCSVIILCFFCVQLFANFLKIAFFENRVQKLGFSNFSVLSSFFENYLFLGLLKHYKIGVSADVCVFVVEREEKGKKMITGISGFGFFVQKWPFRDAQLLFKNNLLKPLFL